VHFQASPIARHGGVLAALGAEGGPSALVRVPRELEIEVLAGHAALDQADDIVLILTLDIPAIRSTQRALEIFDRLGYPRKKVRIVVNRWSKQIDLDLRQVEKFLGEPVVGFVPSDYQTAVSSINLGTPLVQAEPGSKIAAEIRRIAQEISLGVAPPNQAKPRGAFWKSFLKKQPPAQAQAQAKFKLQASMEKV